MLETMNNVEVTDMVANDDVTTSVAEAVAENTGRFEFDLTSGLIGAGIVIGVQIAYKNLPKVWRWITSKAGKKNDDYVFPDDDDDESDEDDTESEDVENDSEDVDSNDETSKPNRAERRNKKNKNK